MSRDLWRQDGGHNTAGSSYVVNNQQNEYHGDVTNIQNNYFGVSHRADWKPSRRCAAIDFGRLSRHFCGRDHELEQLNSALKVGEGLLLCAVYGISGLGKSHLAIKYGKNSFESEKYTHVFWISVDTETKFLSGLEALLVKLDHPAQSDSDQKAKIEIVKRWLEDADEDQRWLLILDGVRRESFDVLQSNLPSIASNGHILLTTQFEDVAKEFVKSQPGPLSILRLKPLTVNDGVALLIASSHMSSEDLSHQDQDKARQLVQRTGCHPLAITFAAACATSTGTLPELLDWTSDDQLMMITEYENTLAESDQRVIKQLFDRQVASIQDEPLALDLFRTLSFFDNSSISIKMLWRGIQTNGSFTEDNPSFATPIFSCRLPQLQKTIQKLASQNLLQVASPGIVNMHDLTNHMSLQSMGDTASSRYLSHACRIISSSFRAIQEPSHRDNWLASDEIIAHIFKLSSITDKLNNSDLELTLDKAADYLEDRGRYSDSQSLYERLLTTRKQNLGPTHPKTLATMESLAGVYDSQGRFQEAEELFQYAVDGRKKQLGPEHPDTLATMGNLAGVYDSQGRLREAEELFQHVLHGKKKQLGPTHPDTPVTMNNLAGVFRSQDRFREAEELFQHVLAGNMKQLGPTHPDTLTTMNNLALVYGYQNRFGEAEQFLQQVVDAGKKQLGPEHPDTLAAMHNLALVYDSQGRFREAEELYQLVLEGRKKQLGVEHPETLTTMHCLAILYESRGLHGEAEKLLRDVVAGREKIFGPGHDHTTSVRDDLERIRQSFTNSDHSDMG